MKTDGGVSGGVIHVRSSLPYRDVYRSTKLENTTPKRFYCHEGKRS